MRNFRAWTTHGFAVAAVTMAVFGCKGNGEAPKTAAVGGAATSNTVAPSQPVGVVSATGFFVQTLLTERSTGDVSLYLHDQTANPLTDSTGCNINTGEASVPGAGGTFNPLSDKVCLL